MVTGSAGVVSSVIQSTSNMAQNQSQHVGDVGQPRKQISEHRRSNKPIMEKRRRARINNCLNELKTLILEAMKKDPARHSKLEKADILEMTVKHLENLQRQNAILDPSVVDKFKAGFDECVEEVNRFQGIESNVKRKLVQHLSSCMVATPKKAKLITNEIDDSSQGGIFLATGPSSGVRLVPTRLSNGDIALVLPSQNTTTPNILPIPCRTSSTASASSNSSCHDDSTSSNICYSPVSSIGWSDSPPHDAKPLSLVKRRRREEVFVESVGDKPWRPW